MTEQPEPSEPAPDDGAGFVPLRRSGFGSWSGSGRTLGRGFGCSGLVVGDGGAVVELCIDETAAAPDVVDTAERGLGSVRHRETLLLLQDGRHALVTEAPLERPPFACLESGGELC